MKRKEQTNKCRPLRAEFRMREDIYTDAYVVLHDALVLPRGCHNAGVPEEEPEWCVHNSLVAER